VSTNTQNQYYRNKILVRDCKEFYNLLKQNKRQCEKCTNQRRNRELLERKVWGKIQCNEEIYWIKTLQTKFKYGMESSIWKKSHNGIKNEVRLESSFKILSCKFLASVVHNNAQIFSSNF